MPAKICDEIFKHLPPFIVLRPALRGFLRALPPLPGRGAGLVLRSQTFSISQQIALLSLWERVDYPGDAVSQSLVFLSHCVHLLVDSIAIIRNSIAFVKHFFVD